MAIRPTLWFIAALAASVAGCSKESAKEQYAAPAMAASQARGAPQVPQAPQATAPAGTAVLRHIAVRQHLVIEAPAAALEEMHKATVDRCRPPACELLESAFTKGNQDRRPAANLRLRIKPDALTDFIARASQGGELVEQRTEAEDKTDRVIDTEARLTNLTELRERLRKLLKSDGAKLKDLIEVERELARVQTELDTAQGMRKLLADETERVAVFIELRAKREFSDSGAFASLRDSLMHSGRTLAESLAALVTFAVAILPWAIAFAVVFAVIRRLWRRRKSTAQNQKNT